MLGYRTLHRARPAPAPAPSAETLVPESTIEEAPVEAEDPAEPRRAETVEAGTDSAGPHRQ